MSSQNEQLKSFSLPSRGFVFWPVGTGDSTTIVVAKEVVLQVDLHHLVAADDHDDPRVAVVDRLVERLPVKNKKPYLALFALTHPDLDHIQGFAELLDRAPIGELWFTPRIFREYKKDLCDDAIAFRDEAKRRVAKTIKEGGDVGSGDRVRIIGYDDLLKEEEFEGFPESELTVPGNAITEIDGTDRSDTFRAFVHAPFKDDSAGDRNDTSLGLQVRLLDRKASANALLLGDLCYPTIKRIFDVSEEDDLTWNILLAPHHCSKSVMYWRDEEDEEETLRQDILDSLESAAGSAGYVVSSSDPIPASNKPGDNPPHALAKKRYEEIVPGQFLCTQETPNEDAPMPIVFSLSSDGLEYQEPEGKQTKAATIAQAVTAARGGGNPPRDKVGFGAIENDGRTARGN